MQSNAIKYSKPCALENKALTQIIFLGHGFLKFLSFTVAKDTFGHSKFLQISVYMYLMFKIDWESGFHIDSKNG